VNVFAQRLSVHKEEEEEEKKLFNNSKP